MKKKEREDWIEDVFEKTKRKGAFELIRLFSDFVKDDEIVFVFIDSMGKRRERFWRGWRGGEVESCVESMMGMELIWEMREGRREEGRELRKKGREGKKMEDLRMRVKVKVKVDLGN